MTWNEAAFSQEPLPSRAFWRGILAIAVDGDCAEPLKQKRMVKFAHEHGAAAILREQPSLVDTLTMIVAAARGIFVTSTLELEDILWVIGCTNEPDDAPLSEAHLRAALQRTQAVEELAADVLALCDGDKTVLRAALARENDPKKPLRTMTDSMWRDLAFDATNYAELVVEREALAAHEQPPTRIRSEVGRRALTDMLKRRSTS